MEKVYLGLGGNIGDTVAILNSALLHISRVPGVLNFRPSHFYKTSPISSLPQSDYLNAVCAFDTLLTPIQLLHAMQSIEKVHGKIEKPKNAPRPLDIDILFYGTLFYQDQNLQIPHPRWKERLFVLAPLAELTEEILVPTGPEKAETMNVHLLIDQVSDSTQTVELYSH